MSAAFEFMKGYTWGYPGVRGEYSHHAAADSMRKLRDTGTQWIGLAFSAHMQHLHDPQIAYAAAQPAMVTDDEIRHAIRLARDLEMKIMLKPMVDTRVGDWRGQIEFGHDWGWKVWWQNYKGFMMHYARIAQECGCEMLCLGCEMYSTQRWEEDWRDLVAQVRGVYGGPITYNANHGSIKNVAWWEVIDLISVSAYYGVGKGADATVAEMVAGWQPVLAELRDNHQAYGKPLFFAECGMMSTRGNSASPASWNPDGKPYDGAEQARYYEAMLRVFWHEPWFKGFFWWRWDALLTRPDASSRNTAKEVVVGEKGFRIYGKPAENTLREWYAKPR